MFSSSSLQVVSLKNLKQGAERLTGSYKTYSPLVKRKELLKFEQQQNPPELSSSQTALVGGEGQGEEEGEEASLTSRAKFFSERMAEFGFMKEGDTSLVKEAREKELVGFGSPLSPAMKIIQPEQVERFGLNTILFSLGGISYVDRNG